MSKQRYYFIFIDIDSYNGDEFFSGNSGNNSEDDTKSKKGFYLSASVVSQKKKEFETFVRSCLKDFKGICRHFESVKSSLGTRIEQVFSPDTMVEYFDRISQKPFSSIANTNKSRWTDDEVLLLTHLVIYYSYENATEFQTLVISYFHFVKFYYLIPSESLVCFEFVCHPSFQNCFLNFFKM